MLTWKSKKGFKYDLDTFDLVYIKDCVDKASRSNVFSVPAREKFTSISTMIQSKM